MSSRAARQRMKDCQLLTEIAQIIHELPMYLCLLFEYKGLWLYYPKHRALDPTRKRGGSEVFPLG